MLKTGQLFIIYLPVRGGRQAPPRECERTRIMTASPRFRHPAVALLAVALLHGTGCGPKEVTPAPAVPIPPPGKPKDDPGTPPAVAKTEATPSLTADQLAREIERNPR